METFRKYFIFLIAVFSALLLIKLLENLPDSDTYIVFQLKEKQTKNSNKEHTFMQGKGQDVIWDEIQQAPLFAQSHELHKEGAKQTQVAKKNGD